MSTAVISVIAVIVAVYTVLGVCLSRRERRRPLEPDRIIREARARTDSYQGPDSLRLMEDLDAHLDAYAAAVDGLYEQPDCTPDPVLAAGLERLRGAIRDEQQKGEL